MKKHHATYVFDFDMTIVGVESLEIMANLSLRHDQNSDSIRKKIAHITEMGMNGTIGFAESLRRRFELLHLNSADISQTIQILKKNITPSIALNQSFFQTHANDIYIVSGGFIEVIVPVVSNLGIREDHVYGNRFITQSDGSITGYERDNPLTLDNGKSNVVLSLGKKNVTVIGDGYSDLKIRIDGLADYFVAFTEHIKRRSIMQKADRVVESFDQFLKTENVTDLVMAL